MNTDSPATTDGAATCLHCGQTSASIFLTKQDARLGEIHLSRCAECGLVFLRNWKSEFNPDLYRYYGNENREHRLRATRKLNRPRIETLLSAFETQLEGRTILDVGCGDGHLTEVAVARGWRAHGIDLSEEAIARCRARGLPCEVRDFFDPKLDTLRPNLIYMSEFIEHVPYPHRFLVRARELLAPQGVVYITTPNFNALTRRLRGAQWHAIHPEHLAYFTPTQIASMLDTAGFQIEHIKTHNVSVNELRQLLTPLRPRLARDQDRRPKMNLEPARPSPDQHLRGALQASRKLRALQSFANRVLTAFHLGDTIIAQGRKPGTTIKRENEKDTTALPSA